MKKIIFLLILISQGECKALDTCVCGAANIGGFGRIVNGVEASPHKYPWMGLMLTPYTNQAFCGGAIIGDRTILTAGHCVWYIQDVLNATWLIGSHSHTQSMSIPNSRYHIADIELHPRWVNSSTFDDFDMALITLDRPIEFNERVRPICLPEVNGEVPFYGQRVIVAGWGRLGDAQNSTGSDVLMETKITLLSPEECHIKVKTVSNFKGYNDDSMICGFRKNYDACQGDSGGPLFVENIPGRYQTIGVVSFGLGCARDFPGIYGKVTTSETLNWIKRNMKNAGSNLCKDVAGGRTRRCKNCK